MVLWYHLPGGWRVWRWPSPERSNLYGLPGGRFEASRLYHQRHGLQSQERAGGPFWRAERSGKQGDPLCWWSSGTFYRRRSSHYACCTFFCAAWFFPGRRDQKSSFCACTKFKTCKRRADPGGACKTSGVPSSRLSADCLWSGSYQGISAGIWPLYGDTSEHSTPLL